MLNIPLYLPMEYTTGDIIYQYRIIGNIWRVGEMFGISGQKIHSILKKEGVVMRKYWTDGELDELKNLYEFGFKSGDGKLDNFCKKINKAKPIVCRMARRLKLNTKQGREKTQEVIDRQTLLVKKWHAENEHPKGMLGKTHTELNKKKQANRMKEMWEDPGSIVNSKEYRQILRDRTSAQLNLRLKNSPSSQYSRVRRGMVEIGKKTYEK